MAVAQSSGALTVSVIVPVYNGEAFLAETIGSVQAQTLPDWELLIVNDGSTDGSAAIAQRFAAEDARIQVFTKPNGGVAAARNFGLERVRGTFVAFLDADDLYEPTNLAQKVAYLAANPATQWVTAAEMPFDSDTGQQHPPISGGEGAVLDALLTFGGNVVHSPTAVMARADFLRGAGGFDEQLSTSADWELWVRLAARSPLGCLAEPLTRYRLHPGQMHRNIARMERDMCYGFRKSKEAGIFQNSGHYRRCLAKLALVLSGSYYRHSTNKGRAIYWGLRSLFIHPGPWLAKFGGRNG